MRTLSDPRRWFRRATALTLAVLLVAALGVTGVGAQPTPVDITVKPDMFEFDNTMGTAKPIEVNGAPQDRTISTADDVDYAKFTGNAGSVYVVEATDPQYILASSLKSKGMPTGDQLTASVIVELYDADGNMVATTRELLGRRFLASVNSAGFIPPPLSRLVWKAPKSGTYYVRVVPVTISPYPWGNIGTYLLSVRNVAASITGHVTNADTGKPAPWTWVQATPWGLGTTVILGGSATFTDQNGDYILYDLPQGQNYSVFFGPEDSDYHQPEWYDNIHSASTTPTPVFLGSADPVNGINAALDIYAPTISGRVVDENGKPAVGVAVHATPGAPVPVSIGNSNYVLTDANGVYHLRNLMDGPWTIQFLDDKNDGPQRYIPEYWDDSSTYSGATAITVTGGVADGSHDATLTEIPVVASGMVKNSAAEPLAYTPVDVYIDSSVAVGVSAQGTDGYGWLGRAYANSKGYWEYRAFGVPTATFKAFAEPSAADAFPMYLDQWYKGKTVNYDDLASYDTARGAASTFAGASGTPGTGVDFALEPVAPFVSGKVTDAVTGAPLKGIQVWAYMNGWGSDHPIEMATTDANGLYRFQQIWYGSWTTDIKLGFFDPAGAYATEYWNDQQTISAADQVLVGYKANKVANAALLGKPGRLFGPDRYSTAISIAANRFQGWEGVKNVVIASGDDAAAADPLTAASLGWAYDAPLLLTSVKDGYAQNALNAVKQINAKNGGTTKVYVVGGPNSVPQSRINELAAAVGAANVERLPYGDRYETARQVALRARQVGTTAGKTLPDFAIVANGADSTKFADALSASAIAGAKGAPILLVSKAGVPAPTASALAALAPTGVYVAGGPASVNDAVYTAVKGTGRMWGANRYSTSVAIAQTAFDKAWLNVEKIGVAAKVPDALTGGVDMGAANGPLLVVKTATLPSETQAFVVKYKQVINTVVVYGGPASISGAVKTAIDKALTQ